MLVKRLKRSDGVSALTSCQENRHGFSRNPTHEYDVSFPPLTMTRFIPYIHHIYSIHTRTGGAGASDSTSPGGAESGVNLVVLMITVSLYPLASQEYGTSGKEGTVGWLRR